MQITFVGIYFNFITNLNFDQINNSETHFATRSYFLSIIYNYFHYNTYGYVPADETIN